MFNQESDESFMRAERCAVNAKRSLLGVIFVPVCQAETFRHSEIHLVCRNGELATDGAPDLHVDLRAVERRFVGDLDEVDAAGDKNVAHHVLRLLPQRRLVHVLLPETFRRASAETHLIFLETENLEILQVHLVDCIELLGELLGRAIDVRVIHVERPHAHQAEEFARLLVPVTSAILRQPQRQIPVTMRLGRKDPVMVRTVHRFEVVSF